MFCVVHAFMSMCCFRVSFLHHKFYSSSLRTNNGLQINCMVGYVMLHIPAAFIIFMQLGEHQAVVC